MARKEKKYHYIYKTTCKITNRYYIGMHSTDNLEDGYIGSGKRLWFSINHHGRENHVKEILEFCDNREELKQREIEIVNEQLLCDGLCMNLKCGGDGGFVNEEHLQKFLEKAITMSIVNKEKILDKKKWLWENNQTWSDNYSKQMSNNSKGNKSWTNKRHSEESKQKISESKKGKYNGENNPSYGTCWITKNETNKKIKKVDLETYLLNGWVKGRK